MNMRARTSLGFCVILAVLFPIIVLAQDVNRDWDKTYDFSKIKTFAMKLGTAWNNQLSQDRVMNDIATQLSSKGWVKTENQDQADALVVVHGATSTKHTLNTFYDGWGGWGYGAMGGSTTTESSYKVGTLVVDIFDAKGKTLLFRGTATDEISDNPEKNSKKISKAAEKMFKDWPTKK